MHASHGVFFDGESAWDRPVQVRLDRGTLAFSSADLDERRWSLKGLIAIERPETGRSLRLTHSGASATRLVLPAGDFVGALVEAAPHLKGGFSPRKGLRIAAPWLAGMAALAGFIYLLLSVAPEQLAYVMPDSWRARLGESTERALASDAKLCGNPLGTAALTTFATRFRENAAELPEFEIRVYDMPIINAFALPGGRIVLTRELLEAADRPEEVAGVAAHEIGHVGFRHAEASAIRVLGLQALITATTGGNDRATDIAGLLAILRYSREAEREADQFALDLLALTAIDPLGLRDFFERILKEEGPAATGIFKTIGSMMSTHPVTRDRIAAIQPLPQGTPPRPVMSSKEWAALKAICE